MDKQSSIWLVWAIFILLIILFIMGAITKAPALTRWEAETAIDHGLLYVKKCQDMPYTCVWQRVKRSGPTEFRGFNRACWLIPYTCGKDCASWVYCYSDDTRYKVRTQGP